MNHTNRRFCFDFFFFFFFFDIAKRVNVGSNRGKLIAEQNKAQGKVKIFDDDEGDGNDSKVATVDAGGDTAAQLVQCSQRSCCCCC